MRIGERWSCARGPRRLTRALTSPRIRRDLTLAVSCEAKDSHTYVLLNSCQQVASEVHRQATGEQTSGQATPTFSDATSVAAGSIPRLRKRASRSAASALNSLCILFPSVPSISCKKNKNIQQEAMHGSSSARAAEDQEGAWADEAYEDGGGPDRTHHKFLDARFRLAGGR